MPEKKKSAKRRPTQKQADFALEFVINGRNASAAYRATYDVKGMAKGTIHRKAFDVRNSPAVVEIIDEYTEQMRRHAAITIDDQFERLNKIFNEAILEDGTADHQTQLKVIDTLNKMRGFYSPEKIEHSGGVEGGSPPVVIEVVRPEAQ